MACLAYMCAHIVLMYAGKGTTLTTDGLGDDYSWTNVCMHVCVWVWVHVRL